jgi:hypothetical protein
MATCPRDGATIEVDYGMATCPVCGVMLFIDMDGVAQLGADAEAPALPNNEEELEFSEVTQVRDEFEEPPAEAEFQELSMEPVPFESPILSDENVVPKPADLPMEAVPLNLDEYATGGSFAGNPSSPQIPVGSPVGNAGDPLGIQDYANSEISSAKDGPTLIRLLISGIDTKEIRESLREAITDSRFGWDVDAIMNSIAKGELRIENVSPVKASIAVNRIKRLPVRIRWEQYAVTQAEQL